MPATCERQPTVKQHDLPPGFYEWSGKRRPRDEGPFHIKLRCGFVDTRIEYMRDDLIWIHDGGPGDIVAVRRA